MSASPEENGTARWEHTFGGGPHAPVRPPKAASAFAERRPLAGPVRPRVAHGQRAVPQVVGAEGGTVPSHSVQQVLEGFGQDPPDLETTAANLIAACSLDELHDRFGKKRGTH
ncbi:hypothetical protein PG993_011787 [Apiospora rasikravindrae]|uniref:Uncharacterized protein n=1 Tax=Apiospora rasikravindrae TaxID=990691 RepID=A0ABR1S288_9PEZI